jgi:hypothetical protein
MKSLKLTRTSPGPTTVLSRPSPFIRLPTELVHYVLQLAAASSRSCSLNVCLVASWARQVALPYLFHTILIDNARTYNKFERYVVDPPYTPVNTNFLARSFVNGLWMQGIHRAEILAIFEACDNIAHLALSDADFSTLFYQSVGLYALKGLSHRAMARNQGIHLTLLDTSFCPWVHGYYGSGPTPIFDSVTHIRLRSIGYYKASIGLDHFSRLSHLSVPYCLGGHHKAKDLQHFLDLESLKILVITVATDVIKKGRWKRLEKWVRKTRETDGRVYLVERGPIFRDEWELEIRSGDSIWDRALRYTNEWESNTNMKMYG